MYGPSTNRHTNGQHTKQKEISITDSLCTRQSKQCQRRYWKIERTPSNCLKIVNNVANSNQQNPLPDGNPEELAEEFADYFLSKIKITRKVFDNTEQYTPRPSNAPLFKRFAPLAEDEVEKEIFNMTTKTCKLDPIPTNLLKQLLPKCLSTITQIVHMSLTQGVFNNKWKTAIVRPLLKKAGLDLIHKNYRPVSNLCFLSKVVEKCMLCQLIDHCDSNNLLPDFQLAYRKDYSTETSLIEITNGTLWAIENQRATLMILLDLSAAFDTVDHDIPSSIFSRNTMASWIRLCIGLKNI